MYVTHPMLAQMGRTGGEFPGIKGGAGHGYEILSFFIFLFTKKKKQQYLKIYNYKFVKTNNIYQLVYLSPVQYAKFLITIIDEL